MQLINDIIGNNMFVTIQWKVNNIIINPALITKPVYQIAANNDNLASKSSILPLYKLFNKSTLLEVEGGHISYLINNNAAKLFEKYTIRNWLIVYIACISKIFLS